MRSGLTETSSLLWTSREWVWTDSVPLPSSVPLPEGSLVASSRTGLGVAGVRVALVLVLCGPRAFLVLIKVASLATSWGLLPLVDRLWLLRCMRRASFGSFLTAPGEGIGSPLALG